ncbi:hypothetical protein HNI00_21945 [Thermoleptolyngbya oregonensis NK1-22]|uniref:Bacteriophage/plasmid primase P4 C-terminal domain-containing protein n=1 Tax=Thermoleptolyngbya oregonensis NK1-22 TaxID=2547457 RepID=A0AA96Y5Z5_9CYAN|nr:hypothetical protein [Thermoleptolyngbya oregonensis]WOB45497.1 hypothetical protein HNI00_21945 [Thermoleptolyngbya oregonensis NK1-22]
MLMIDRSKLTPEVDSNFPCPVCGATSGCRANREIAFCRGDRRRPKKIGWRRWGQEGDFSVWATLSGQDLLEAKLELRTDQGREKGEKGEKGDRPASTEAEGRSPSQIAYEALYSDRPWATILGRLYRWAGTHYELASDDTELKRIAEFFNNFSVEKKGRLTYPYAADRHVRNALAWVKLITAIDPSAVNPSGAINCTNGVLVFDWKGNYPTPRLEPHDPTRHYFLNPPGTAYDPNAPTGDCDRLLAALDPPEQQILLRTIAASIDIDRVRKFHGRLVRGVLAQGVGSNGKDAHREAFSQIFGGAGLISAGFEDFAQYDDGRKFPLAGLRSARISWASENRPGINLDKLQSLKRAITGDPLHFELKGRDHEEFLPKAVLIFNINDLPNLKAGLEAIKTRFAILTYRKIYKTGADPERGEIEADPRFKYDPEFLRKNVLPALLNRLVEAFQALIVEGIDYSPCDCALEKIKIYNSHLFEFSLESGLTPDRDSVIPIKEFWARLESWYRSTEVLTWQKNCNAWAEPIRRGDDWVKGANQIYNRFSALFPSIELVNLGGNRRGIKGLKFVPPRPSSTVLPEPEPELKPEPELEPEQPTPAPQSHQVGDRVIVSASGLDGIITRIEGDRALVDGQKVFGWFACVELEAPRLLEVSGRAGP